MSRVTAMSRESTSRHSTVSIYYFQFLTEKEIEKKKTKKRKEIGAKIKLSHSNINVLLLSFFSLLLFILNGKHLKWLEFMRINCVRGEREKKIYTQSQVNVNQEKRKAHQIFNWCSRICCNCNSKFTHYIYVVYMAKE